jgi:hypothetical protein
MRWARWLGPVVVAGAAAVLLDRSGRPAVALVVAAAGMAWVVVQVACRGRAEQVLFGAGPFAPGRVLAPAALTAGSALWAWAHALTVELVVLGALGAVLVGWAVAVLAGRADRRWGPVLLAASVAVTFGSGPSLQAVATVALAGVVGAQRFGEGFGAEVAAARRDRRGLAVLLWGAATVWVVLGRGATGVGGAVDAVVGVVAFVAALVAVWGAAAVPAVRSAAPEGVRERRVPRWLLGALALVVLGAGAWGVARQWPLNDDPDLTDQGAYLQYAGRLADEPGRIVLDRNRMPLFPLLASARVDPSDPIDRQMAGGKAVGVVVAAVGSLALGAWLWRRAGLLAGVAGLAVVVGSVAMFKAPYVAADLLVFFGLLASAVCCWRVLRAPTALRGAVTGLVLGLTQLAKASASPMLAILVVVGVLAVVLPERFTGASASVRRRLPAALLAAVVVAVLTLMPYAAGSDRGYGSPAYNTNSTYYLWYDSWQEALAGTVSHGDNVGRPRMPADEIPTWRTYVRDHDAGDVASRLVDGLDRQVDRAQRSYGWLRFLVLAALGAGAAAAVSGRRRSGRHRMPVLFGAVTVPVYLALTSWWMPIAEGERFTLVMFLPVLCFLVLATERLGRGRWLVWRGTAVEAPTLLLSGLLLALVLRLPWLVDLAGTMSGGV